MPPVPEKDPIVSKSYAAYYVICMMILMVTLFWALWDESFGQRPWKALQQVWKERYSAFLNSTRSKSSQSVKEVEQESQYQQLEQAYKDANETARPRRDELQKQITDLSAKILAVQNVFTDRRAYVNALTYELETETSASGKKSKQEDIDDYKKKKATVEFPDGHKQQYNFHELEETYNSLKDERTKLSAELGDVLKPVTEASNKMSSFVSDHMVALTPAQIDGLKKKTEEWDPKIVQINVADANIVDRCESCHMNAREPLRITAAVMTAKGEKRPDEYAHAFTSHPEPELLKTHDPDKFGCSPCHQGNGRATTSLEKAHGNYEHWLWPLFPKQNAEAGCQTCHAADMRLAVGDVGEHISDGKFLFRQRGCMGCHRYEGYDREPEELTSIAQQMKLFDQQKIDNAKISADLMKQADTASSNDEANRLNQEAVALRVANSKIDGQVQQLDFQTHSLMQDVKKIGPNLKDVRLKLNQNWIPVWLKKPTDFRPTTKMPNFRLTDHQIQTISAYLWQSGFTDASAQAKTRQCRPRQTIVRNPRLPGLPLHRRRRSVAGRHLRRQSESRGREGELRLPGPLDSQRAGAHAALLSVREEGHRPRGLRQERSALPVRSAAQPVPQRRTRTASAEHDGDAQPAAGSGGCAGHRHLPDESEKAGAFRLCPGFLHGRS